MLANVLASLLGDSFLKQIAEYIVLIGIMNFSLQESAFIDYRSGDETITDLNV